MYNRCVCLERGRVGDDLYVEILMLELSHAANVRDCDRIFVFVVDFTT